MITVCEKCHRVLVKGKWVMGVPPIGKVATTICPKCQKTPSDKGMVYQESGTRIILDKRILLGSNVGRHKTCPYFSECQDRMKGFYSR